MTKEKKGLLKSFLTWFDMNKAFFQKDNSNNVDMYDQVIDILLSENSTKNRNNIEEKKLIKNILSTKEKRIEDIMTPRVDIVSIPHDIEFEEAIEIFKEEGFSRLLVYKENLDNVIGFLHVKDLLYQFPNSSTKFNISDIVREVLFISPYMKVLNLFFLMQKKGSHLAVVIDEFGGVDGLVTIEDIIEEILGEIIDEYDIIPQNQITRKSNHSVEAYGRIEIEELEENIGQFATEEERQESNTVAGLIVYLVGYIPNVNEIIEHSSGVKFEILSADAVKIDKVLIDYSALQEEEHNNKI